MFKKSAVFVAFLLCFGCMQREKTGFDGYIEGEYVYVSPYAGGVLDEVNVAKGDSVAVGDKLFSVDSEIWRLELKRAAEEVARARSSLADLNKGTRKEELDVILKQKEQAEAVLANALSEFRRIAALFESGNATRSAYDARKAEYETAKAKVAELSASYKAGGLKAREDRIAAARADLKIAVSNLEKLERQASEMSVRAKTAGRVEDVFFRKGEFVAAGRPVLSLLPPENVKVRFFVPQKDLARVKPNMKVRVTCDGCGGDRLAEVVFISGKAEYTPPVIYSVESRQKLVFMVEAVFENKAENLHPGQPVTVEIGENG